MIIPTSRSPGAPSSGSSDEALVRGRLADVIDEIADLRATIRARRGWVMDVYALRLPER